MPIILELTDDQALKIVAQLGQLLSNSKKVEQNKTYDKNVPYKIVLDYIKDKTKGTIVGVKDLADKFKVESKFISNVMVNAKKNDLVRMDRRGYWITI